MKKVIEFAAGIFSIPFALLFLIFVRLISPIIVIRWCSLISTRIGHFAENTNIYLSEKQIGVLKLDRRIIIDIFYFYSNVSNKQLAKMFKRNIFILPYFFMNKVNYINEKIFNKLFKTNIHDIGYYRNLNDLKNHKKYKIDKLADGVEKNLLFPPLAANDSLNAQEQSKLNISFTKDEVKKGKKILSDFGIDIDKRKIVGIILRDNNYLKKNYPNIDWNYHKIRDSEYKFYRECVEELVKLNYTVFVIGLNDENIEDNKNIINYSKSVLKDDFMDIFLTSNFQFAISSANGLDAIPIIFKRPIVEVAVAPLILIRPYTSKIKTLFKTYYSKTLKRKLSLKEIFQLNLQNLQGGMLSDEIEFIHPTQKEITSAMLELHQNLQNNFKYSDNDMILQERFKKTYLELVEVYAKHRVLKNFSGSIGNLFLKNNEYLLDK